MDEKVIVITLGEALSEKCSIERLEKWNEFVNKLTSYKFVFVPGSGAYTTIKKLSKSDYC